MNDCLAQMNNDTYSNKSTSTGARLSTFMITSKVVYDNTYSNKSWAEHRGRRSSVFSSPFKPRTTRKSLPTSNFDD